MCQLFPRLDLVVVPPYLHTDEVKASKQVCRQDERGCLLGLPSWKVEGGAGIYTSKDVATV